MAKIPFRYPMDRKITAIIRQDFYKEKRAVTEEQLLSMTSNELENGLYN